jgi:hypothetical protein
MQIFGGAYRHAWKYQNIIYERVNKFTLFEGIMGIYQIVWHWFNAGDNGYHTVDINIPPALVGVQVNMHGANLRGTGYTGIKHYRKRLASGMDQDIDFGDWFRWPPVIFDRISSVTLAIATGSGQRAWLVARMDYWE